MPKRQHIAQWRQSIRPTGVLWMPLPTIDGAPSGTAGVIFNKSRHRSLCRPARCKAGVPSLTPNGGMLGPYSSVGRGGEVPLALDLTSDGLASWIIQSLADSNANAATNES